MSSLIYDGTIYYDSEVASAFENLLYDLELDLDSEEVVEVEEDVIYLVEE